MMMMMMMMMILTDFHSAVKLQFLTNKYLVPTYSIKVVRINCLHYHISSIIKFCLYIHVQRSQQPKYKVRLLQVAGLQYVSHNEFNIFPKKSTTNYL